MALVNTRAAKFLGRSVNFLVSQGINKTESGTFRPRLLDVRNFSDHDSDDGSENTKKKSSSKATSLGSRQSEINSCMTLLQDGLRIQELPVLVKKTTDVPGWTDMSENNDKTIEIDPIVSENVQNEELNKVVQLHLRQVNTIKEVLQYLLVIPTKDVTPLVAFSILERIIELRNDATDEGVTRKTSTTEGHIITTLCNIICKSKNSAIILNGLETVIKIRLHVPEVEKKKYIDIFIKECLERVHSRQLSLIHICGLVENLFNAGSSFQGISDHVWSEIVAREGEISIENINRVFALLLYLKSSRKIVLGMLERHISTMYSKLQQKQVIHMLHILCLLKLHSSALLGVFSSWTRLNVHQLTEAGLRDITMLMNSIQYTSTPFETSIERFMKAKGDKCKDTLLMTALAEKVQIFHWRSPVVLNCISRFFVQNVNNMSSDTWGGLVQVFGDLNYEPSNAFQLFETLEKTLSEKMPEIDPEAVISILLSCVYIQRYPLNFVKKLFSPGFLDRLNFQAGNDEPRRQRAYNNLKLLDTALNLECPAYTGPYLPRNLTAKSLKIDGRLLRSHTKVRTLLCRILGDQTLFSCSVVLPKLPLNHLYIVDFIIHLDKHGKPQPYSQVSGIHRRVAIILLLPEYFCKPNQEFLTGPQAMRMRHLNLIGLSVIKLEVFALEQQSLKFTAEYLAMKLSQIASLDQVLT